MPEYTELVSSCLLAQTWFSTVKATCKFTLDRITIDASAKEQEAASNRIEKANDLANTLSQAAVKNTELAPAAAKAATDAATITAANSNVANGYPYDVEPGCTVSRGQNSAQGFVYPPPLGSLPISQANIELSNIEFNPRNVILEMNCRKTRTGQLFLQVNLKTRHILLAYALRIVQVQMLTHTILQVYTGEQWRKSICQVSCKACLALLSCPYLKFTWMYAS